MVLSHTGLEDRKRPVAPSAEICGSGGNASACGGSLSLSGTAVCPAGSVGCRNRSFTFYTLRASHNTCGAGGFRPLGLYICERIHLPLFILNLQKHSLVITLK